MNEAGIHYLCMNWVVDYPFRLKDRCRIDTPDYVFQPQLGTGLLSTRSGWQEFPDWPSHARTLPTIEDELAKLPQPSAMDRAIYVIHMPPFGEGLDECWSGERVGSIALSRFLEEKQPLYALHGHIHESPQVTGRWQASVGRTTCIQPGQGPQFTYVLLDLETGEVRRNTGGAY